MFNVRSGEQVSHKRNEASAFIRKKWEQKLQNEQEKK